MKGVTIQKVKVSFTAKQWQLYTSSMKCDGAARALNAAATKALNAALAAKAKGAGRDRCVSLVHPFCEAQRKYSAFGAADSEPSGLFWSVFDQLIDFHVD